MLIANADLIHPGLKALDNLAFAFHLTGSQFFGGKAPNDYDFFVKEHPDLSDALKVLGFVRIAGGNYQDSSISSLWLARYSNHLPIHIQVIKLEFFEAKKDAQYLIQKHFLFGYLTHNKVIQRRIWDALIEALMRGE